MTDRAGGAENTIARVLGPGRAQIGHLGQPRDYDFCSF
jgi:hypothetical protein